MDAEAAGRAHRRLCRIAAAGRRKASSREESGVLPVAMGGDFDAYLAIGAARMSPRRGCAPGCSTRPPAIRCPMRCGCAVEIAAERDLSGPALARADPWLCAKRVWADRGFYRMLDAMLFRAAEPGERWRVILERFYRLNPALIGRFYAGQIDMAGQGAHPDRQAAGPGRPRARGDRGRRRGGRNEIGGVIGAGFGGLALAIRLQSAGVETMHRRGARQARRARLYLGARRLHLRCRADGHHRSRLPQRIMGADRAATWPRTSS